MGVLPSVLSPKTLRRTRLSRTLGILHLLLHLRRTGMRLLWLALLLLLAAPGDRPPGGGGAPVPESLAAARFAADSPFLPGTGLRTLPGPLQLPDLQGPQDPPGALYSSRGAATDAASSLSCLAPGQRGPGLLPVRICERLPYDATAPPSIG